ncbi:chemotaxis-specific protein-glutamate methyltransferase CheB [Candidatus Chlorohelix sp.]|uniref:chemotaxis-specific protein-glutamate methyltransferase CheB n=1 Tax=Candidatus Chlorohelix sp. TaxID=3139201 RepID=UPI003029390D
MNTIRVLVVEDSDMVAEILIQALESDRHIKVAGRAANGREALELLPRLKPDLITMDVWMPIMDGFQTVARIMETNPTPILVVTSTNLKEDVQLSLRMIAAGALDVIEKPTMSAWNMWAHQKKELVTKVRLLAGIKTYTKTSPLKPRSEIAETKPDYVIANAEPIKNNFRLNKAPVHEDYQYQIVAMASSTGGPTALLKILAALSPDLPIPFIVVQHISEGFTRELVEWLNREVALEVRVAKDGELLESGVVLFSPDRYNIKVTQGRRVSLNAAGKVVLCPNADILMQSVAENYGNRGIGVILTGMGGDGAKGLSSMHAAGAYTLAQDEATSLIYGMPKAAFAAGAVREVLPLESIAPRLTVLSRQLLRRTNL